MLNNTAHSQLFHFKTVSNLKFVPQNNDDFFKQIISLFNLVDLYKQYSEMFMPNNILTHTCLGIHHFF